MRVEFRIYMLFYGDRVPISTFDSYQEAQEYIENNCGSGDYSIEKFFVK